MDQEDDESLTLPKWPFYAGDVFLVGSAVAIAFLGGWNLTDWQVASCVAAVALGAFLFVLPFIVEYRLRLKERGETFTRGQALLERSIGGLAERLGALEGELAGWQSRLDAIVGSSEGVAERTGAKVEGVFETVAELKRELAALSASTEERLAALKEAMPEDGGVQAAVFASLSEKVSRLDARVAGLRETAEKPPSPAGRADPDSVPENRPRRKKEAPGPKLLHRAIRENGEAGTPAVSRIIGAGPGPKVPTEPTEPKVPTESIEPKEPTEATDQSEPPTADGPPGDELLVAVEEAPKERKARRRKGQAQVVARVLIGIGNKPYLRGSGGGLSWDQGVPMEFEEINKWSWMAPPDCGEIEVRVYRNDEDPDLEGSGALKPGETLELSPRF